MLSIFIFLDQIFKWSISEPERQKEHLKSDSQSLKCFILFEQAGLLILTKDFNQFVWEEEVQVLGLPQFYLGDYSIYLLCHFIYTVHVLFQALFLLGVGSGLSVIVFICEELI